MSRDIDPSARTVERKAYTTRQVAELCGLHPETIREALRSGRIKGVKVGQKWLVTVGEVDRLLNEGDRAAS